MNPVPGRIMHQSFQPNPTRPSYHFSPFGACCLLLLAAAAAAAKPGRSTLDPKKDYKTKTGSTSSVTATLGLIKTENWDRGGGGGNITYDW